MDPTVSGFVLCLLGKGVRVVFAGDAWHALSAVVCLWQFVEEADGIWIEVLEALKCLWRFMVEDVVRRCVF